MTKPEMKSAKEWAESSLLGLMTFDTKRGRPVVKRLADVIEAVQYEAHLAGAVAGLEAAVESLRETTLICSRGYWGSLRVAAAAIKKIDPAKLRGGK